MHTSLKALLIGAALLSAGGMGVAGVGTAVGTHAAIPANPCAAALPANPGLPTEGGIQTYTTLRGGGYTFGLNQFGPQGLNPDLRHFFGVTPPAGDAVATWDFTLPGGTRTYVGLAHVFRQGATQHACLWGGVAYLNPGNGNFVAQAAAVTITLDAVVGLRAGLPGRVDLRLNGAHYRVTGYPQICRPSRSNGMRC